VLIGAGGLGRRTLAGLRTVGRPPVAFVDNNPRNWHTTIDGVEVLPPEEAVARWGETGTFVVTIWRAGGPHRFEHTRRQFEGLGCRRVVSFALLYWKHAEALLPFYAQELPHRVLEDGVAVRGAYALLADERSRHEYVAQVRWRLHADFDGLPHPVPGPQYLADELFAWRDDEVIVDCGAYDGDTVRALLERSLPFARLLGLEPDPTNYAALRSCVQGLPADVQARIDVRPLAVGAAPGTLYIDTGGTAASATSADARPGTVAVDCVRLDDLLAGEHPTFLKMDIEGAEPEALAGAAATIATYRPVLAVCVYHVQDHLWQLPLQMHAHHAGYRLYLRPYNEEGWDLVCYAVPPDRVRASDAVGSAEAAT
jgi:FkbM family methyltransferase